MTEDELLVHYYQFDGKLPLFCVYFIGEAKKLNALVYLLSGKVVFGIWFRKLEGRDYCKRFRKSSDCT